MKNKTCQNCKHWIVKEEERYIDFNYGHCKEVGDKIEIEIVAGWEGGYVKKIETEYDFSCVLWSEKVNEK